jgi:hypothetical protein
MGIWENKSPHLSLQRKVEEFNNLLEGFDALLRSWNYFLRSSDSLSCIEAMDLSFPINTLSRIGVCRDQQTRPCSTSFLIGILLLKCRKMKEPDRRQ